MHRRVPLHETLENYVTVEIFSKLSAEEKRVLSALSIFQPVELEALAQQGLNTDELDGLVESGLARQADSETYDVHDLIREFLLRSLSPALREEFHMPSAWIGIKSNPPRKTSSSNSFITPSNPVSLTTLRRSWSRKVANSSLKVYMELLGLIEQIHTEELKPEVVVRLAQLQGDMLALLGRLDEAEQVLSDSLERAKKSTDELVQAEILSSMADVSRKQGEKRPLAEPTQDGASALHFPSDARWAARTYNNIGYLLRRKNERAKALEAYGEVEAILEGSDDVGLINSQITLARSLIDLGEADRARRTRHGDPRANVRLGRHGPACSGTGRARPVLLQGGTIRTGSVSLLGSARSHDGG